MRSTQIIRAVTIAIISGVLSFNASAHALWLEGDTSAAKLYFGEYNENLREPSPGRLDSIIDPAVTVIDPAGREKSANAIRGSDHFALPSGATVLVQALKQPVSEPRGEKPAQKRFYYARLGKGGSLPLDIQNSGELLHLTFMGKPVAKVEIVIVAPSGWEKHLRTDDNGETSFSLPEAGLYVIEAKYELNKPGEFEGKAYAIENHRGTLSLYK